LKVRNGSGLFWFCLITGISRGTCRRHGMPYTTMDWDCTLSSFPSDLLPGKYRVPSKLSQGGSANVVCLRGYFRWTYFAYKGELSSHRVLQLDLWDPISQMRLSLILAVVAAFNLTVSMPIADSDSGCPYKCNALKFAYCCLNRVFLSYEDPSGES
jgi:hypothetical protein